MPVWYESEETLIAWHDDDGASTLSNFTTSTSTNWAGQVIRPDWTVVAPGQFVVSWYPTAISMKVGKTSGTIAFTFQVKRTDTSQKPTSLVLDAVGLATGSVPTIATSTTQPPWTGPLAFANPGAGSDVFYDEWVAFQFTPSGIGQTGYIGQQTNGTVQSPVTDNMRVNSTNGGVSWATPSTTIDLIYKLWGKYKVMPGVAVPTLDAATTDTIAAGTGATTRTFAHAVGANDGNDTALFLAVAHKSTSETDGMCVGVTYAGLDMQEVYYSGANAITGGVLWVKWYRLNNPPVGTDNVVATFSTANHEGVLGAASFFQVHQSETEGGTDVLLTGSGVTAINKVVGILGDINLVAAVWDATTASSTATPQGNTTTIAGSQSAVNIYGGVVGYSVGDVPTGWLLNAVTTKSAVGIVGVNHAQGYNWARRNSPDFLLYGQSQPESPGMGGF